jgi:hypothetical protein
MSDDAPPHTPEERKTARLIKRFRAHIKEWYPHIDCADRYLFDFYVEDIPCQIWRGRPPTPDGSAVATSVNFNNSDIWFLWTGQEVQSYNRQSEAFVDFINEKKTQRLDSKFKYWTSPLTVSVIIAILLLTLISTLELRNKEVPQQLWSLFTAVVAFYFGRESSKMSENKSPDDVTGSG